MVIPRRQTLVQLNDELVDLLDGEALRRGISRSALIREAVATHLHDARETQIDRKIIDAYTRIPQTEDELGWMDFHVGESLRALEEEEEQPW